MRPMVVTAAAAVLAATTLAALALLAVARPVAARCVEPAPIDEAVRTADVVIVGVVTAVAQEGTRATVRVEDVWRAPAHLAVQAEVTVHGGPGEGLTSVDRTFVVDARYLFTITLSPDGRLTDSQCSSTAEWEPTLAALRPPGAMPPAADDAPPGGTDAPQPTSGEAAPFDPWTVIGPAGVAIAVALALLGAGLLARGRLAQP